MMAQPPAWLPTEAPSEIESPSSASPEWEPGALRLVTGNRALGWLAFHLQAEIDQTIWIDLDGARTVADAVLLTGRAVGASPPGNLRSLTSKLESLPIKHVVWDGRNVSIDVVHATHQMMTALTDNRQCWATTTIEKDKTAFRIDSETIDIPLALPHDLDVLAWFSASQRIVVDLPPELQRPDAQVGRVRCDVLARLQQHPRRSMGSIADQVIAHHQDLFAIATGATVQDASPEDLFGLRLIAEYATDENVACLAGAAASRLRTRFGQMNQATERIEQVLRRSTFADPAHRALLLWAQAVAILETGDATDAESRFIDATNLAHSARDLGLLATMHRRWADTLSERGHHTQAAEHYRKARSIYRRRANPEGVCAALRGSADQAVSMGEVMSAEALYDQSDMHTTTDIEHANRLLGWANLAISQGGWDRATSLLDRANRIGGDHRLIEANCTRRKADVSLRSGDPISAISLGKTARLQFESLGHSLAAVKCLRLVADAEAMQGAYRNALSLYRQALQEHIRCGDTRGFEKTVTHVSALLHSLGEPRPATHLQEIAGKIHLGVV